MTSYIFPGQGAQFLGMGKELYENEAIARDLFNQANDILNFSITDIMFNSSDEDLKQTKVTQPSIYLYSVILSKAMGGEFRPSMVAGHSLGEFSALVANDVLAFECGLELVFKRAIAMQKACEKYPGTMAAILGLEDYIVEEVCDKVQGIVVPANYNCAGQLVISGEKDAVNRACKKLKEAGAKRTLLLPIGGAFHSPLMKSAEDELAVAIEDTIFNKPSCPIYQNVTTKAVMKPEEIKKNLISQLTAPVKWIQSIKQMIEDGANRFVEVGPGKVLQGLVKKIDRQKDVFSAEV